MHCPLTACAEAIAVAQALPQCVGGTNDERGPNGIWKFDYILSSGYYIATRKNFAL